MHLWKTKLQQRNKNAKIQVTTELKSLTSLSAFACKYGKSANKDENPNCLSFIKKPS